MRNIYDLGITLVFTCLLTAVLVGRADAVQLGHMKADKILFLGNSITATEQAGTTTMWGLTASEPAKDYVHLLAGKIDEETGGSLTLIPTIMPFTNPDGSIAQNESNVVNIADVFERGYRSYNASKIANQLAWQADIVVLQFCENIPTDPPNTFDPETFTVKLRELVNDLKQNGDPNIFITSYILGDPAGVDAIKRQIVAEDPARRVFVNLADVMQHPENVGGYNHPSDAGMAVIAGTIYDAMDAHSTPEPGSVAIMTTGALMVLGYVWKKRKNN